MGLGTWTVTNLGEPVFSESILPRDLWASLRDSIVNTGVSPCQGSGYRRSVPKVRDSSESADLALHARVLTFLRRRIQTGRDSSVAGGPEAVAQILNHVPRSVEKAVTERFEAEDQPLFESIARLMFVFEDFVLVDPPAIRKVADQVGADEIALALKGVPREVAAHILGALDEERVAAIEQADASLGRVRRSDVESAQHDLIEELRRLEDRGEVAVARPDEVVE